MNIVPVPSSAVATTAHDIPAETTEQEHSR